MTRSQNGWLASPNRADLDITSPHVPGTNVEFPQGIRGGDVETVLMYVAEQFHHTVEPLHAGWCWGFFYKPIEGSNELSNHASGTAIDLNAPIHPMGRQGTFSATEVAAIRRILGYCEGAVRWGGDYTGRKDEMHFEIVGSAPLVARIARKIKTPPVPHTKLYQGAAIPALIHQGSGQYLGSISGPANSHGGFNVAEQGIVKMLQQRLIVCRFVPGVSDPHSGWADGIFDRRTDRPGTGATSQAVARFQRAHMPNTRFLGQVWYDDWHVLFNL